MVFGHLAVGVGGGIGVAVQPMQADGLLRKVSIAPGAKVGWAMMKFVMATRSQNPAHRPSG